MYAIVVYCKAHHQIYCIVSNKHSPLINAPHQKGYHLSNVTCYIKTYLFLVLPLIRYDVKCLGKCKENKRKNEPCFHHIFRRLTLTFNNEVSFLSLNFICFEIDYISLYKNDPKRYVLMWCITNIFQYVGSQQNCDKACTSIYGKIHCHQGVY